MIEGINLFSILAWISLPTVMYGGYLLLGFLVRGKLSAPQKTYFRAGHAHAGVLLLMALLYVQHMKLTALSDSVKLGALSLLVIGILAQSGGFFLQMLMSKPDVASLGPRVTRLGAILLMTAVLVLVYGLITTWSR
jgi:hypothetical protein